MRRREFIAGLGSAAAQIKGQRPTPHTGRCPSLVPHRAYPSQDFALVEEIQPGGI
jgi:hypothetical protein